MDKEKKHDKISTFSLAYSIILVIVVFVVVFGVIIYNSKERSGWTAKAERIVPYPAVILDWRNFITYDELDSNLRSVRQFYEKQDFSELGFRIDFSTDEGKLRLKLKEKDLINKMIEDLAIEAAARKYDVQLSKSDVDAAVSRELEKYGTEEDVKRKLEILYGWNLDEFKEKVVRPNLLRDRLVAVFSDRDKSEEEAKNKIAKAKKELLEGKEFESVARSYSEGKSSEEGGEVGWFSYDQMIEPVAQAATTIKKGQVSGIIETELGFHIIRLEDIKTDENQEQQYRLKQIITRKNLFYQWLYEEVENMKLIVIMKEYRWNKDLSGVEFVDERLRELEQEMLSSPVGDPSLMF